MTAKRFTLIECNGNIEDSYTQNVYDGGEDVFELLDLLNELHKENNEEELDYFKSKCGSLEEKLFYISRENEQLKKELFEVSKELLWATSDDVDRALYFENEVEDLRKEIFE